MIRSRVTALHQLEAQGAQYTREELHEARALDMLLHGDHVTSVRYLWTLPRPAGLDVEFAREGRAQQLIKLFKSELQLEDPLFDAAVYIETEDEAKVARLLGDEAVRDAVRRTVLAGGHIEVKASLIVYEIPDFEAPQDTVHMVQFVEEVLRRAPEASNT